MDFEDAFRIALTLISVLGGFMLRSISKKLEDLQRTDDELKNDLHRVEVLVAGDYVKHSDLEKVLAPIAVQLQKIYDKLDAKADKK